MLAKNSPDTAGIQTACVTVDDHREHARSYRGMQLSVGASLLAMVVNDNAGCLAHSGAWASIASKLAPTRDRG